jgi:hypothetical protein
MDGRGSTEDRGLSWPAMLARRFPFGQRDEPDEAGSGNGWCAADNEQRSMHCAESIDDGHSTSYS